VHLSQKNLDFLNEWSADPKNKCTYAEAWQDLCVHAAALNVHWEWIKYGHQEKTSLIIEYHRKKSFELRDTFGREMLRVIKEWSNK